MLFGIASVFVTYKRYATKSAQNRGCNLQKGMVILMRKDERDILFARATYKKGSPEHKEYYQRHPEKLEYDEKMREKSVMGDSSSVFYQPLISNIPFACFDFLGDIKHLSEGSVSAVTVEASPEQFTKTLLGLAKLYGAEQASVVVLKDEHYYSHKGRPHTEYGNPIATDYKYGIAFFVPMEKQLIDTAPHVIQSVAVTKGYIDTAIIGMVLSYYIRSLGYEARNNMDGNYLFPLPKVAEDAGLGEIGMNGMLITKSHGPRVRLGLVSTNIPLIETVEKKQYIREFCSECKICQSRCPSKAIKDSLDDFGDEACLSMWQHLGSDCGVCLASCPFSSELPRELTDDLSTVESRKKLLQYCTEKLPRWSSSKNHPDWLQRP